MMIWLGHEPLGPQGCRYGYDKHARRPFNVHEPTTRKTSLLEEVRIRRPTVEVDRRTATAPNGSLNPLSGVRAFYGKNAFRVILR